MNILLVEDMPTFGKHIAQELWLQTRQDHQRLFTGFPLLDGEASNAQAAAGGA